MNNVQQHGIQNSEEFWSMALAKISSTEVIDLDVPSKAHEEFVSLGNALRSLDAEENELDEKEKSFLESISRRRSALVQQQKEIIGQLMSLAKETALKGKNLKPTHKSEFEDIEAAIRDL